MTSMIANPTQSARIDPTDLPDQSVIFGCTSSMREIRNRIDRILFTDLPVLIHGESGTGKEVVAQFLHTRSNRFNAPFVKLNCAAIPPSLLERELFGYLKGSCAGAGEDRVGLIEIAEGGALFLEEIEELDWNLQGKLLRLLQDGSFSRIGESQPRFARIRVICATNVDLRRAVQTGAFREELFYRLSVVSLRLSPLRSRRCDIPQLCEYFLRKLSRKFGRIAPKLSPATLHLLMQWDWPGNLRELENWIARTIILGDDLALGAELKRRLAITGAMDSRRPRIGSKKASFRPVTSAAKRAAILRVLQANRWNRRKTARDLNISYRSLHYRLREVGIRQRRRGHPGFPPAGR